MQLSFQPKSFARVWAREMQPACIKIQVRYIHHTDQNGQIMMIRRKTFTRILLAGGLFLPVAQFAAAQQPRPLNPARGREMTFPAVPTPTAR